MVNNHTIVVNTHTNIENDTIWVYRADTILWKAAVCWKGAFFMNSKQEANPPEQKDLFKSATYTVKGKKFIVVPVFNDKSSQTLSEILLKLIKKDIEKP